MYEEIDFDIFDKYIIAEMADNEKDIDPSSYGSETEIFVLNLLYGCSYDDAVKKGIPEECIMSDFIGLNEGIGFFIFDNADLIETNSKYDEYRKKCWGNDWRCWEE